MIDTFYPINEMSFYDTRLIMDNCLPLVTDGVTNMLTYDEEIYIALVHVVTYDMTDASLIPSVTKKKVLFH
jgi:hypothetical protein